MTETPAPKFSHRIEAEFARILDYYGVAWEYEPRSFALEWDENGAVKIAFTPDLDVYKRQRCTSTTSGR